MLADEFDFDPVIGITWVIEQRVLKNIRLVPSAHFSKHILVSVMIKICERNAMTFLQMTEAARIGDIGERLSALITEHQIRHESRKFGVACCKVKIQETVVIKVSKIASHWLCFLDDPHFSRDVLKSFSITPIQTIGSRIGFSRELVADVFDAGRIA